MKGHLLESWSFFGIWMKTKMQGFLTVSRTLSFMTACTMSSRRHLPASHRLISHLFISIGP